MVKLSFKTWRTAGIKCEPLLLAWYSQIRRGLLNYMLCISAINIPELIILNAIKKSLNAKIVYFF